MIINLFWSEREDNERERERKKRERERDAKDTYEDIHLLHFYYLKMNLAEPRPSSTRPLYLPFPLFPYKGVEINKFSSFYLYTLSLPSK